MIGPTISSPIRLLFTSSDHLAERWIRQLTGSPASHVAIAIGENSDTLVHAVPRGVTVEPRKAWMERSNAWTVAEYEIRPDVNVGLQRILNCIGQSYDFLFPADYALAYFYRHAIGGPLRTLYREFRSSKSCAQLALLLNADQQTIPEWGKMEMATVVPGDLLQYANGPSFRRLR